MKPQAVISRKTEWIVDDKGKAKYMAIEVLECGHEHHCLATPQNLKAKKRFCSVTCSASKWPAEIYEPKRKGAAKPQGVKSDEQEY